MSDLYDDDIVLWSERQGDLLRRLALGEKVNAQIDWENVAEEIETVGRNERRACESFLIQALLHELKLRAWPDSRAASHWEAEVRRARDDARDAYTPAMRQQISMLLLYRRALNAMPGEIDGRPPLAVPESCPFTLDELLAPVKRPG